MSILPLEGVSKAFNEMLAARGVDIDAECRQFLEFAQRHYPGGARMSPYTFGERFAAWLAARMPAEEVQLMDHIVKHAVRGSTYKAVTSLNILVNAQILETQGRRAAIEAAIAAKDTP